MGTEIAGYRIQALIGRGGMGIVYLAEQSYPKRKVALKVLPPELAEDSSFRQRFIKESNAAAAIDHPNIIPIYSAGEEDGVLHIAMRYVEGTDLRNAIQADGPLSADRALSVVAQVGSALDAAHAQGLVHRDVKPANILIASGLGPEDADHVYLADFGLTKRTTSKTGLTGVGQFVGTLDYIAPEQIQGKEVDGRVDIYALGCVLYECLSGEPPFRRDDDAAVMWAHLQEEPPALSELRPDLPPGLDAVLRKAVAKSPEDRYQRCSGLVGAFRRELTEARRSRMHSRNLAAAAAGASAPPVSPAQTVPGGPLSPARLGDGQPVVGVREPGRAAPPPRKRSRYWIVALVAAALVGGAAVAVPLILRGSGGGGEEPLALSAERTGLLGATLRWSPPESGADHFEIIRDGQVIAGDVPAGALSFVDPNMSLGIEHRYRVVAVDPNGGRTFSDVVTMTAHTPPLEEAQLSGGYSVLGEYTRKVDYNDPHETFTEHWEISVCSEPPCQTIQVTITGGEQPDLYFGFPPPTGQLSRSGSQYTGRIVDGAFTYCEEDGQPVLEDVGTIDIRITEAEAQGGIWRATRFEGTVDQFSPAVRGCNAFSYAADLLATSEDVVSPEEPSSSTVAEPSSSTVAGAEPPVSDAVLSGSFNVRETITAQDGYGDPVGRTYRETWEFSGCETAPCDRLELTLLYPGLKTTGILTRSGSGYQGTLEAGSWTTCGPQSTRSTTDVLSVSLEVVGAETLGGVWQATSLRGSVQLSAPAAGSCPTYSYESAITGQLVA